MSIDTEKDISTNNSETNLIKISKEDVALLEKEFFDGRIIVIQSSEEAKKAITYLSKFKTVGIDTESKPSFKKGRQNKIALLQISTTECCFLFRLNIMGFTPEMATFFENGNIPPLSFIELNACSGGCVGGVLTLQNPSDIIPWIYR